MEKYLTFILTAILTPVMVLFVMIVGFYYGWSDRAVIAVCACVAAILFLLFELVVEDDYQEQKNEQDLDTHNTPDVHHAA